MAKAQQKVSPAAAGLSLPPDEISFRKHVEDQWKGILSSWKRGWAADTTLDALENTIEFNRVKIFEEKQPLDPRLFDWELDWLQAKNVHSYNVDLVRNHKKHIDDLKVLWLEWSNRNYDYIREISIEALRSMVLVNGAAIIAALTVLSGQIDHPWSAAVLVAKLTVFTSVVSLLMIAAGHALLFQRVGDVTGRVRGVLIGNTKHHKLYAVGRYLRRYVDPQIGMANILIYGSIIVFGMSALICSFILLGSSGPSVIPSA
ncbi:hypothetical protein [Mesorhizobium sp. M0047]|uniref:hypothetical protein n=1 Tax=Mesorhizobium sp. M0047 TaxID=2956859 RepID=UPI0033382168